MKNLLRKLLNYRAKLVARKEAVESWERRVVDPIVASGRDELLATAYKHRFKAVLHSLLIGIFFVIGLVAYAMNNGEWLSDHRFYLILVVSGIGVIWTSRETLYHFRKWAQKMERWLAENDPHF